MTDNLPRILPPKTRAEIRLGSWDIPEVFHVIQEHGGVASDEMLRVFNMGVGMVLAVEPEEAGEVLKILKKNGEKAFPMGTVQKGGSGVVYDFGVAEETLV